MPSVLDATLVIQIVHFLCAYWILSNFFLKPAYAAVMKIDSERAALKNAALQQQEELNLQRQEQVAELTALQLELLRAAPAVKLETDELHGTLRSSRVDSDRNLYRGADKVALVKQLAEQLKKRVLHE